MTTKMFLDTLYNTAESGSLTIFTLPDSRTVYFPVTDLPAAAAYAEECRDSSDVYFGIGLRGEKKSGRGGSDDVTVLPGFWHDVDIFGPAHKEAALPLTMEEALAFVDALPHKPSLTVFSGNGLHCYWLFSELLVIKPENRKNVAAALRGWQQYINNTAREHGWKLDNTSDLARILRVPNTINHKPECDNAVVTVIGQNDVWFSLSDFEPYIKEAASDNVETEAAIFTGTMGSGERIFEQCAFIRHCRDNAANLPEPQWYAAISNLALCSDGETLCHEISKSYPDYTVSETSDKTVHARKSAKPCTCSYIRNTLSFDCDDCAANCKAPVALAIISKAETVQTLLDTEIEDYTVVLTDKYIEALHYAKNNMPNEYARFKMLIKGKVSLRDLERCIRDYGEKLARAMYNDEVEESPLFMHDIDLSGAVVPRRWQVSVKDGVRSADEGIVACPAPVVITRSLVNLDTGKERLELTFRRDGRWKPIVCNRTTVYNKTNILGLGDEGLHVTSNSAPALVEYLSDYETANIKHIPRVSSISRLGWIDDTQFFPCSVKKPIVFEEDKNTAALYHNLAPQGDFEAWKAMMKKLRKNNIARFITSASFASPLLCKMNVRPFAIHIWEMSASGKSAVLKAGVSVWGNPLKLMGSGFTTLVGMEQMAGTLRHLPLGIDEKQSADERRLSLSQLIYILSQGYGKIRGAKVGGNAEVASWHNISIITGEEPITKNSSMDGVQTRCFELYGKPVDDVDFAKDVHIISENNYGHAGVEFMKAICSDLERKPGMLRDMFANAASDLRERGLHNVHADYVAAVTVGDFIAETTVFGTDAQTAYREALQCAEEIYAINASQMSADTTERAWNFIKGWLVGNEKRFTADAFPCYGRLISRGKHYEYSVIPQYLDEALEDAGFNVQKTMKGLRDKKLIDLYRDSEGKLRTKTKIRIGDKTLWGYKFNIPCDGSEPSACEFEEDDFLK